jgi:t-SNARE complex subunit (syntaxin)
LLLNPPTDKAELRSGFSCFQAKTELNSHIERIENEIVQMRNHLAKVQVEQTQTVDVLKRQVDNVGNDVVVLKKKYVGAIFNYKYLNVL